MLFGYKIGRCSQEETVRSLTHYQMDYFSVEVTFSLCTPVLSGLYPFCLIPFRLIPFRLTKDAGVSFCLIFFFMQIMVHLLFEYPITSFDCSLECLVVPRGSLSAL